MQPIARATGRAIGLKGRTQSACPGIAGREVEVDDAVERPARPDERVDRLTLERRRPAFRDAVALPRLVTIVAPKILRPRARLRRTISRMPAITASAFAPPDRSLIPSSQITADTPDSPATSRSKRSSAEGPPATGLAAYAGGDTTRLPPMPALTTDTRAPCAAWSRRDRTSGQRSSPLSVDAVPSVIESPKHATTTVSDGASTSMASRKYQDVVVNANAASLSSAPWLPDRGAERYEVVSALACHVIGPVDPTAWKLTTSFRPASSGSAALVTKLRSTGSLVSAPPAGIVTLVRPRSKSTRRFVPAVTLPPLLCNPTNTSSKVTGRVPKTFVSRRRAVFPQRSGLTISRNV